MGLYVSINVSKMSGVTVYVNHAYGVLCKFDY